MTLTPQIPQPAAPSAHPTATVTDCKSPLYGTLVYVQASSGTLRLVQAVRGGPQTLVAARHLRIEQVAA